MLKRLSFIFFLLALGSGGAGERIRFFLAILFLVLAVFAETMDEWTLEGGPIRPQRVFPCCFVD